MEMLPGRIEHWTMAHRGHLHVRLESDVRGLLLDLLLDHAVVGRGIIKDQILGFWLLRLCLLSSPLCLARLKVSELSFGALTILALVEKISEHAGLDRLIVWVRRRLGCLRLGSVVRDRPSDRVDRARDGLAFLGWRGDGRLR